MIELGVRRGHIVRWNPLGSTVLVDDLDQGMALKEKTAHDVVMQFVAYWTNLR